MNGDDKWVFSNNGHDFNSDQYSSADAAFRAWASDYDAKPGALGYVGRVRACRAGDFAFFDVSSLGENAAEDGHGDWVDNWPDSTAEQDSELESAIEDAVNAWADKHGLQPTFYEVYDVEQREYTPEEHARDTAPPMSPERAAELAQDDADTLAVDGEVERG